MGLTLNIIEHELNTLGDVRRGTSENPLFDGVRLYMADGFSRDERTLYLCDSREDALFISNAEGASLYINPNDSRPCEHSLLSITGGEPVLVVLNALLDAFDRFGSWEKTMDRICLADGSLQDLLDVSSSFLKNNVVIVDSALKLLAHTRDVPCDDPITMELIAHGYHTEDNIRKFKLHKRFKPWAEQDGYVVNDTYEICKYATIVKTFKTRTSFSLIIVMMCNVVHPKEYLYDIYDMLSQRVERYALRDYPDDKPSGDATDTFLKSLFAGDLEEDASKNLCSYAGIPHNAHFCLFYIKPDEKGLPPSRLLSDISRVVAPAKTVLMDGAVVVLCFNCMNDRCALHCFAGSCPLEGGSVSARINGLMERHDMICGRSSKFTSLAQAPCAFGQAKEAHEIGRKKIEAEKSLDIPRNWSRIFSFDSCYIDYLVKQIGERNASFIEFAYAGHVLDDLAKSDIKSKTDNYSFLYTYLMSERRASVVADKLFMHRNNVKYRINRIEEQFGIDTDDDILRFDLLLAFRLREAAFMQKA